MQDLLNLDEIKNVTFAKGRILEINERIDEIQPLISDLAVKGVNCLGGYNYDFKHIITDTDGLKKIIFDLEPLEKELKNLTEAKKQICKIWGLKF